MIRRALLPSESSVMNFYINPDDHCAAHTVCHRRFGFATAD